MAFKASVSFICRSIFRLHSSKIGFGHGSPRQASTPKTLATWRHVSFGLDDIESAAQMAAALASMEGSARLQCAASRSPSQIQSQPHHSLAQRVVPRFT
jgi:hypothetical protein